MEDFNIENEKIVDVDLEREIKQSFLDYSMSVIVSRALPDVRDGLKPVHRRILYSMDENGITHDKPTRKSATIVGAVLGSYHPHGDMSVYGALVRLAQDFSMRYPLVEGQGNFGSVDGDPPAAYRYTEARMARISRLMLEDIDKETVDFVPNFDDTSKEPSVLPTRIPNLLVNGSNGIAVGMATNIPPHNLNEVVDACVYLLENPDCQPLDLMNCIQGPDFPTGGIIMGRSGIRAAYATGRGKITLRGKAEIEEFKNGRQQIIITEIPYMVNKAELVKKIADLVKDKRVDGISDLRDESDKSGLRVVIELKRDANAQIVLNLLYRYTQLQDTVGIIMLALDNGVPRIMDLKTLLQRFLEFREEVVRRRTVFELKKASDRAHVLEGLRRAVDIVDDIIRTIRATKGGRAEAKLAIMEAFGFDDPQASAIVAFQLGQLAGLEILKIDNELGELHARIAEYNDILSNRGHLLRIVREELEDIKKRYGDERRTRIEAISGDVDIEDLIPRQESIITRTHFGYVKRQPIDEYRAQRRGGRGISGMTRKEEDFVEEMFACNSHDHLMYMTNLGRVYDTKCYEIPEGSRQSKGTNIVNLLPLIPGEKISSILKVADPDDEEFLIMVTKNGTIKRTALKNFAHIRKTGIIGIELVEGDELVTAVITDGTRQILVGTRNGMSIRFDENDLRPIGRTSMGVRAIRLKEGDEVIGMASVDGDSVLLTVSEEGKGRLTPVGDFTLQQRGGQGIRNYDCRKGNHVAGFRVVDVDKDDAILISQNGTVIRMNVSDIAFQSRYGMGVNVMRLDEGDRVVTLATTLREDVEIEVEPAHERPEGEGEEVYAESTMEELEALILEDVADGEEQQDEHLTENEDE